MAAESLPCAASVNGAEIQLERSPLGLYLIAVEDPHFDEYDVVIDTTNAKVVKIRAAHFIATALVPKLKVELKKVSEELQSEILKLAKARVVDASTGYTEDGFAALKLQQGDDSLDVVCWKESK